MTDLFETDDLTITSPTNKKRTPLIQSLTKEILEDLYLIKGHSLEDIARQFNCTRPMIQLIMEKHGIQRRKRSEARVLAIKNNKFENFEHDDINEDFFSHWSPEMAWVLGLIFTDGNFQNSGQTGFRVQITSVNFDLLGNVRKLMNSKREIKKQVQSYDKSKYIYSFEFYREKMRNDLQRIGLLERKSLIMQFPDMPQEYIRHFIRGCWDGDGSFFQSAGRLRGSYVSGSKEFMERLVEELYLAGIYRKHIGRESEDTIVKLRKQYSLYKYPLKIYVETRSNNPSYSIKINSYENLGVLYHFLYDGVDESMYLKRKYEILKNGLPLDIIDKTFYKPNTLSQRERFLKNKTNKTANSSRSGNRKILKIGNSNRKLKCSMCKTADEIMYCVDKIYCHTCLP